MRDIPAITKNLLIINILMFAAYYVFQRLRIDLNNLLGLHFFLSSDFHIYQLFTYMFMHGGLTHIFFNMFALWMFGRIVENVWGPKRFLTYYLVCGVGAGLIQECGQYIHLIENCSTVGASGAIYGILLAFGMLFPEERIFIFPLPVPIKAKWFVVLYAILELWLGFKLPGDGIAHFAHLGGMLFGYLLIRYWRKNQYGGFGGGMYGNYGGRQSIFSKMKDYWEKHSQKFSRSARSATGRETDWEYNARKKREQDEVDRILDKIRRSGYDSLTADEKKKLFDNGKQ